MEECGKIEILGAWVSSQLMGHKIDLKKLKSVLASHKAKNSSNAYLLPLSDAEKIARDKSDWKAASDTFREQQTEFHRVSNEQKNAALYVDLVEDKLFLSRYRS